MSESDTTAIVKKDDHTTIVLFGITGDLSKKKLLPALQKLAEYKNFSVIGVGRSHLSAEEQEFLFGNLRKIIEGKNNGAHITYVFGGYESDELYIEVLNKIPQNETYCVYTSLPPFSYKGALNGYAKQNDETKARGTFYFEKPFGLSGEEANTLFKIAHDGNLKILSIDHYKAKFASLILDKLADTNSDTLSNISDQKIIFEINIIEKTDASARGAFYDATGALRDVFQNHMLQVINKACRAFSILNTALHEQCFTEYVSNKLKGNQSSEIKIGKVIRAQYQEYVNTKGVASDSQTETFFSFSIMLFEQFEFVFTSGKAFNYGESDLKVFVDDAERKELVFEGIFSGNEDIRSSIDNLNTELELKKSTVEKRDAYEVIFSSILDKEKDVFVSNQEIKDSWVITEFIQNELLKTPLLTYPQGSDTVLT